jgi:hypothetical protein
MNTLPSLQVDQLVQLVERKILDMTGEEMFEKGEIQVLKDCRDILFQKSPLKAKHLEHLIDLVEIRILRAAADGDADAQEFAHLKACRSTLLDLAAERRDVRVIPFPTLYLLEDMEGTVH